jgi:hypothetical protein
MILLKQLPLPHSCTNGLELGLLVAKKKLYPLGCLGHAHCLLIIVTSFFSCLHLRQV